MEPERQSGQRVLDEVVRQLVIDDAIDAALGIGVEEDEVHLLVAEKETADRRAAPEGRVAVRRKDEVLRKT